MICEYSANTSASRRHIGDAGHVGDIRDDEVGAGVDTTAFINWVYCEVKPLIGVMLEGMPVMSATSASLLPIQIMSVVGLS